MSDPAKSKKSKDKILPLDDPEQLGISKGVYAGGHMFKEGLIWGLIATVASYGILAIGRKPGNAVDVVAIALEEWHKGFKEGLGKGVTWVAEKVFRNKTIDKQHATGSAITATSVIVGGLVGHVVQVPAGVKGWKQGQQASDKYDNLRTANRNLNRDNQILAEDNARLNEALAKVQRPDPIAEKDAAATRSV